MSATESRDQSRSHQKQLEPRKNFIAVQQMLHCKFFDKKSLLHQTFVYFVTIFSTEQCPGCSVARCLVYLFADQLSPPKVVLFLQIFARWYKFMLFQVVLRRQHPCHHIDFIITHFYCLVVVVLCLNCRHYVSQLISSICLLQLSY